MGVVDVASALFTTACEGRVQDGMEAVQNTSCVDFGELPSDGFLWRASGRPVVDEEGVVRVCVKGWMVLVGEELMEGVGVEALDARARSRLM